MPKSSGKNGAHAWVPECMNVGRLSYIVLQAFEQLYRRTFSPTPQHLAVLRVAKQFIHLLMNSLLCQVPEPLRASQYSGEIDLSEAAYQVLAKLQGYGGMLGNAVKSLNTVWRKGNEREEGGK